MIVVLYTWVKKNIVTLVNAGSLIGTIGVTSVLGFGYWWLAVRMFPPQAIGFASAAISVMTLLGTIGILGLGTLLVGELPRQAGNEGPLICTALLVAGAVVGFLGIGFALVAPLLSTDFQMLRANIGTIALFAAGCCFTGITLVLDEALIGLLRAELQLSRNAIFAIAKLVALIVMSLWLSYKSGLAIYATWTLGSMISLVAFAGLVFLKHETWSKKIYQPRWGLLRQWGFAALKHHGFNLTLDAPLQALPVLVTIMLSATANAWFYIALSIAGLANVVPTALTMVLYAEGSAQPALLAYKIRLTLSLAFAASLLAISVLLIGTKLILGIFGHNYAEEAAWCLRILALTSLSGIIRSHYVALCRIQRRIGRAILPLTLVGTLQLLGSALGARLGGLTGMSLGWLIADGVCAVFMLPAIYKAAQIGSLIHRMDARRKQCVS